jgi:cytochrome b pre-mRNA-processing protein 3
MIFKLFRRSPQARIIARLYGAIVAQARMPEFYRTYGVPDTVSGRFEMVVLHVVIMLNRLRAEPGSAEAAGQGVFDSFCSDMDGNLREMGVGDLAVPAKMRRLGEAFYGRQQTYESALSAAGDVPLAEALGRTIFGLEHGTNASALRLAAYVRVAVRHLAAQGGGLLDEAGAVFVDPGKIPGSGPSTPAVETSAKTSTGD